MVLLKSPPLPTSKLFRIACPRPCHARNMDTIILAGFGGVVRIVAYCSCVRGDGGRTECPKGPKGLGERRAADCVTRWSRDRVA